MPAREIYGCQLPSVTKYDDGEIVVQHQHGKNRPRFDHADNLDPGFGGEFYKGPKYAKAKKEYLEKIDDQIAQARICAGFFGREANKKSDVGNTARAAFENDKQLIENLKKERSKAAEGSCVIA